MAGLRRVLATHLTVRPFYHHPLIDRFSRGDIIAQVHIEEPNGARIGAHILLPHVSQPELQTGSGGGSGNFQNTCCALSIILGTHISYSFNPCRKLGIRDYLLYFANRGTKVQMGGLGFQDTPSSLNLRTRPEVGDLHGMCSSCSVALQSTCCSWPGSLWELSHLPCSL